MSSPDQLYPDFWEEEHELLVLSGQEYFEASTRQPWEDGQLCSICSSVRAAERTVAVTCRTAKATASSATLVVYISRFGQSDVE